MYIAEGATYWVFHAGTGNGTQFETQSEHSFHAGGQPISYMVGQRCPAFPAGTFVVGWEYGSGGKGYVFVHHVENEVLEETNEPKAKVEVLFQ